VSSGQESAGRLRYAIFFFVGSTLLVLGVLCDPSFVAGFLSGDRSLGPVYLSDANKAKNWMGLRRWRLDLPLEFIDDDELVGVTPRAIRPRKKLLKGHERKRASRAASA